MNKEEKEQMRDAEIDDKEVQKLEGDIKKSFTTILVVVGAVLLILLVLWIYAAFIVDDTYVTESGIESEYTYNGYPFTKNGQLWQTQVFKETSVGLQQYDILVYFSPKEVLDVNIQLNLYKEIYDSERIVLALNDSALVQEENAANAAIAAIELGKIIGTKYNIMNKQTFSAVVSPMQDFGENVDIVDCSLAKVNDTVVIVFGVAQETAVYKADNGCIYVDGSTGREIIRAADRFMYQITGVMRT